MDEIINQVAQRTGIPADKARTAVETVASYLKGRLPQQLAGPIDAALSGKSKNEISTELNVAKEGLGHLFGR